MLESFIIGVFVSIDIVIFYVFFEAVLIPMFLIIGIWGGENRLYATFKFFLYTLAGSVLMLLAIVSILVFYCELSFAEENLEVYYSASEFWMGSTKGEGQSDEHPRHKVYLDAFSIDNSPSVTSIW